MKVKITIKVKMNCDKCRNKALKIAAEVRGVISVAIEGDEKNKVVVTGEDVDSVCLGMLLKKKFCHVTVLTVEEVKPPKPPDPGPQKEDKKCKWCTTVCIVPTTPCTQSPSHKCSGECKASSKCHSPPPCPRRCPMPPCRSSCSPPCPRPCPPPCPPPCPLPCPSRSYCQVVYDPSPEACSIQ